MSVEMEDGVAANLQAAARLVDALQKNPNTRRPLLELIKKAAPQVSIPEIDAAKPLEDKIAALTSSIDELKTGMIQKDQNSQLEAARTRMRNEYNYTDEGLKTLEAFMLANNVGDHMIAHDAIEHRKPKPSPLRPQFNTKTVFSEDEKSDQEWFSSPDAKLDSELSKAFDAIANGMAG